MPPITVVMPCTTTAWLPLALAGAHAKGLAGVMLWEAGQDALGERESLLAAAMRVTKL